MHLNIFINFCRLTKLDLVSGDDELVMAIDPKKKELLYYEDAVDLNTAMDTLDKGLLIDKPAVKVHNDKEDWYIDICSPVVLSLFRLLDDEIVIHEIHSTYATRVDNFSSYDTISKHIIQQRPSGPNIKFSGNYPIKLESQGIYEGSDIKVLSSSAQVGPFTLVGSGTRIGDYSKISNSVIVMKRQLYWNNVTVQDGCQLNNPFCDGVVIKSGVVLEPGVVLSFKVVVGPKFHVPDYSKASLLTQPTNQPRHTLDLPKWELILASSGITEVGVSGVDYYIWSDAPKPEMLPGAGIRADSESSDPDNDDDFDKEVEASFLRAVHETVSVQYGTIGCAGAIFWLVMNLALETPLDFAPVFDKILHELYEKKVLTKEVILLRASEKEGSESFIEWLKGQRKK
ncbi:hypothetical protein MKX01_019522 [Papaver californicum]|nr:hypothetical protein MKX01_019522 [Papaver californicum]